MAIKAADKKLGIQGSRKIQNLDPEEKFSNWKLADEPLTYQ